MNSDIPIIPKPVSIKPGNGRFALTPQTKVSVQSKSAEIEAAGRYLADALGLTFSTSASAKDGNICFTTERAPAACGDEGYELEITTGSVVLRASKPAGFFYGAQTIRQLLSAGRTRGKLPAATIFDKPRFAWRGLLLDVGRHFRDKEFVKRYIDLLAYHKMNVFHWHLTEDQGWRIEIKRYPKLTEIGAWRRGKAGPLSSQQPPQPAPGERYGGFYTQEEIREVVAHAASRHVTVVPEIEMPGHCMAALASYPHLSCTGGPFEVQCRSGIFEDVYCAGNEQTFEFLENVLMEILALFPSKCIHIGGDECPKTRWKTCPKCQKRIREEGLRDESELQSYFIKRIEKFLNASGRRLVGWDEILEGGLAPNATVTWWRGVEGAVAAAKAGHDVVASPTTHCYLDYSHEKTSLEKAYSFEPIPAALSPSEANRIIGIQGNMWTELTPTEEDVNRQVFPRLCALAEVAWSPAKARDYADFSRRMATHSRRLADFGIKIANTS